MGRITANQAMLAQLRGVVEPVEILDSSGQVLGHYTPALSPEKQALYAKVKGLFDLEEAERVANTERQGFSTDEVKRHLQSLGKK